MSDTIGLTHRKVGDSIRFIAHHHDVNGNRLLAFVDVDSDPGSKRPVESGVRAADYVSSETATVDEVLSAEEDGFHFVAYLATWHGMQVAISDPLAHSHYALGEQLRFTAYKLAIPGKRTLSFTVAPGMTGGVPAAREAKLEEPGIVEEVLTAAVEGYRSQAYVVQWHDARVVVSEPPAALHRGVGDYILFSVVRTPNGVLRFLAASEAAENSDIVVPSNQSLTYETAPVEEVLTAQTGDARYIAYIVKWHGTRVAVTDMFANTHHAVGDLLHFTMSRVASRGREELDFMLFDFSDLPAQRQVAVTTLKP